MRPCFNPRLRTGGDSIPVSQRHLHHWFQSTPPHGRRRCNAMEYPCAMPVSIHASAREATVITRRQGLACLVSIHASAREATVGGKGKKKLWRVSIHASAREATSTRLQRLHGHGKFQSTPPHGRRRRSLLPCKGAMRFQSTPPHGRRPSWQRAALSMWRVSIHASAREATQALGLSHASRLVSIHASAREATVTGVGLRG